MKILTGLSWRDRDFSWAYGLIPIYQKVVFHPLRAEMITACLSWWKHIFSPSTIANGIHKNDRPKTLKTLTALTCEINCRIMTCMTCMAILMASSFLYSLRWRQHRNNFTTMFPQRQVEVWVDSASVQVVALRCEGCIKTYPCTNGLHNNLKKISAFLLAIYAALCFDCAVLLSLWPSPKPCPSLVKANVVGLLEDAAAPILLSSVALARDDFTRIFQRGYASMLKYTGKTCKTLQTAWY